MTTAPHPQSATLEKPAAALLQQVEAHALQFLLGALLIVVPLALSIRASLEQPFFLDDAMIYLQYAKNIASGEGWTFNPGANDHASTSALMPVVMSLFFRVADSTESVLHSLKVFEALTTALGVSLFYRLLCVAGIRPLAAALAVAFMLSSRSVAAYHFFAGMETSLYLVFISATLLAFHARRLYAVGALTGVLYLIRPDAILVGPILSLLDLYLHRSQGVRAWLSRWWAPGALALAVVAPWWIYFLVSKGSMLPASGEVKLLTASNWGAYWTKLPYILRESRYCLAMGAIGALALADRRSPIFAILLPCAGLVLLYVVLGMPKAPWYYLPFALAFFTLVAVGFDEISDKLLRRSWQNWGAVALVLVVYLGASSTGVQQILSRGEFFATGTRKLDGGYGEAARWIARNTHPDVTVAAGAIGYVGFHADRHIVDMVGLVEPDIARANAAGDSMYWYREHRPDYVIRMLVYAQPLEAHYRLLQVFGDPRFGNQRVGVFQRMAEPPG
ncbi:MAG: hypothetical protein JRG96_08395 [Deltaproteobacteria bacterium]|nr:hypothetical protein [Deltaproteobacteria bacterium]MBW2418048.1 hypothetical protein [Deltaproteobacteria bacterium]